MTAWTRCADRMPDDDQTVLIVMDDGEVWTGWHDGDHGWRYVSGDPVNCVVTHWAEFPAPPEAA